MDAYTLTLVLGGAGLVAMAATGAAHLGTHHSHGGHEGHAPVPHGRAHAGAGDGVSAGTVLRDLATSLASPRAIFSLLLGFGLTGVVLRPFLHGALLAIAAAAGAALLEAVVTGPLWRFCFRFASRPALTLESALLGDARATTGFDGAGQGLVTVEVDGQIVQCLATLRADDRALGIRVGAGDRLRVEDVDAGRQQCTVSYVGRAEPGR